MPLRLLAIIALVISIVGCSSRDAHPFSVAVEPSTDCATSYLNGDAYFTDQDTLRFGIRVVYLSNTKDSTVGLPIHIAQKRIADANRRYAPARVQFTLTGVLNVYGTIADNTVLKVPKDKQFMMSDFALHNIVFAEQASLTAYVYARSGADIDASGIAGGIGSSFFAIREGYFSGDYRTTEHELGHCLGLYHTHQEDSTPGFSVTTGDKVCDTPYGPPLMDHVDKDCAVDRSTPLPKGAAELLVRNLMSYNRLCREEFTDGQIARMRWVITQSPELRSMLLNRAERIEALINEL